MRTLLETIGTRLEGNEGTSRGRRPALPDRWKFLTQLAAHHRLRPSRENAYEVMDALLELCWPSGQTSTQRMRRSRQAAAQVQPELQPLDAEMEDEEPADQGQARAPVIVALSHTLRARAMCGLGGLGRFGILPDELMQEILRIRKTEDAALTIQRMWRGFTARVMPLTAYLDCLQLWNYDPMYEDDCAHTSAPSPHTSDPRRDDVVCKPGCRHPTTTMLAISQWSP